jgi:hypothetical protein
MAKGHTITFNSQLSTLNYVKESRRQNMAAALALQ